MRTLAINRDFGKTTFALLLTRGEFGEKSGLAPRRQAGSSWLAELENTAMYIWLHAAAIRGLRQVTA
jgi:hypothetical protein